MARSKNIRLAGALMAGLLSAAPPAADACSTFLLHARAAHPETNRRSI